MKWFARCSGLLALCGFISGLSVRAWDYELHRLVNHLALEALPADFAGFLRETDAAERIRFLSGEPDRWRNSTDPVLRHQNAPDHYFDLEDLEPLGLTAESLSSLSGEYLVQVARARATRADRFGPDLIAPGDSDGTRWFPGLLPWRIAAEYARLRSSWSTLKTLEQHGGQPAEIANARLNVIQVMGTLGHYVGDAAQPLHTTRHYNGWVGENPQGFTTNRTFHAWIDGGYLRRIGVDAGDLRGRMRTARLAWQGEPTMPRDNLVPVAMAFVRDQYALVEPLYRLERDGKLAAAPSDGPEGRRLLEGQLVAGAQWLADLWWSAWTQAGTDTYLRSQLARRQAAAAKPPEDGGGRVNP